MPLFSSAPPEIRELRLPTNIYFDWCMEYMVLGYPHPTITWLKDNEPIPLDTSIVKDVIVRRTVNSLYGCLKFNTPSHLNNGHYTLIAKNPLGSVNATVYSTFLKEPGMLGISF